MHGIHLLKVGNAIQLRHLPMSITPPPRSTSPRTGSAPCCPSPCSGTSSSIATQSFLLVLSSVLGRCKWQLNNLQWSLLILIFYRASLSACIRLVYTVNLTNANEYLYGISDVVLWGYAENGVGMIVGCVATLRPLFRRIFDLGGDTQPNNTAGASYAKRPAVKLRTKGRDEEWVALSDPKVTSVVHARTLPDSSSEEHILGNGIKVTRTVERSIDRSN